MTKKITLHKIKEKLNEAHHKIFSSEGSPSEIALGAAIPIGIEFLPLPFINIAISLAISKLCKANIIVTGVVSIAIKPLFPLFVSINYIISDLIFSHFKYPGHLLKMTGIFKDHGSKFLTASLFDCLMVGVISYFAIYFLVRKYRKE